MFPCNLLSIWSLLALSVLVSACGRAAKMHAEEQTQPLTAAESTAQADSGESKPARGGKRPGAGRKPNLAKVRLKGGSRTKIPDAVDNGDVGAIIIGLLQS